MTLDGDGNKTLSQCHSQVQCYSNCMDNCKDYCTAFFMKTVVCAFSRLQNKACERSGSGRNFRSPFTPFSVKPLTAPLPLTRFSGPLRSIFHSRSTHMLWLQYRPMGLCFTVLYYCVIVHSALRRLESVFARLGIGLEIKRLGLEIRLTTYYGLGLGLGLGSFICKFFFQI